LTGGSNGAYTDNLCFFPWILKMFTCKVLIEYKGKK
jgi:hypothetical protein